MRLQKFLAQTGIASRRKSEELIRDGKIKVNGETVREMGFLVDPETDIVEYQNKRLKAEEKRVYLMLNKPPGCVCTCSDDKGRKTVLDYAGKTRERLYPVGRLDFLSEGLLILTNDGALANALTHPKHNVAKKYIAAVEGPLTSAQLKKLREGVTLDDGYKTRPCGVRVLNISDNRSEVAIVLHEGKNRQIRRMFEAIGKKVLYLKRVEVGGLKLADLKSGACRPLSDEEVARLKTFYGKKN